MGEEEEEEEELTAEELAARQKKEQAEAKKDEGNAFYKSKDFDEAIRCYEEALAIEPDNMTYHTNIAAVLLAQKKYAEAIERCQVALEAGSRGGASFSQKAKA